MMEETAQRLGITIRYERLEGTVIPPKDGICKVKGEDLLFIDRRRTVKEKIRILAEAIGSMEMETAYIAPVVRELVEKNRPRDTDM